MTDETVAKRGSLQARRESPAAEAGRQRRRAKSWNQIALWRLPDATAFSTDPALCDPIAVVREFRRQPFAEALRDLSDSSPTWAGDLAQWRGSGFRKIGRPRMAGDWTALYLAYVLSGSPALQPFFHAMRSSDVWRACGFERRPSFQALDLRFGELESRWEAFELVGRSLIQQAKAAEPRIGEVVMVDATAWHSPSALEHCCVDLEACRRAGGAPPRLRADDDRVVLDARWREVESNGALKWDDGAPNGTRREIERVRASDGRSVEYRLFVINGHTYRSLDTTAGLRRYATTTTWFGGYVQAAIDSLTGLAIAIEVFPADVQEWDGYPDLFDGLVDALGERPYVVSVDRGYATRPFYEFNVRRGVAVVSPLRKTPNKAERLDWRTDDYDEDGIPRCRSCGGEGNQDSPGLGLVFVGGKPMIRFQCAAPLTPECMKIQRIECSTEWLMLVPLSRKTELYHAIRKAHSNKEAFFRHLRERYGSAGKDFTGQLRRRGLPAQRLRASASVLLDWFRLNLRQGWLEAVELPVDVRSTAPERLSGKQDRQSGRLTTPGYGAEGLAELLRAREADDTDLPYGAAWERVAKRLDHERLA
jgi:Transposase DDE domain